ncbi:MAG TPA: extracellular solute-binding protein [Bacillota bacterium]|nr:extracellular solute-binding protein [Bacillota bacterium]
MRKISARIISICFICTLLLNVYSFTGQASATFDVSEDNLALTEETPSPRARLTYAEYIGKYEDSQIGSSEIVIKATDYTAFEGQVLVTDDTLRTGSDSFVEWEFYVEETGLYNLEVRYYPTVSKGGDIERTLYIDNEVPFSEAMYMSFSRIYKDKSTSFERDSNDNDIRPEQGETPRWLVHTFRDPQEFIREDLQLYLTKGNHTIGLSAVKEELELDTLTFKPAQSPPDYSEYREAGSSRLNSDKVQLQWVEAETPLEKSTFTIYPLFDKKSSATYPQDPVKIRLNTIGANKWTLAGQWITWEVDIKESGHYKIAPRYRQEAYAGGYVSRRLLVDGECPFREAEAIRFNYTDRWKIEPLGNEDTDFVFYLEKGIHTITMSVVMGDMTEVIDTTQSVLEQLNEDYRRILMLTGPSPDIYRDYDYVNLIPDVLESMEQGADKLRNIIDLLNEETDLKGDYTVQLNKLVIVLDKIKERPEDISSLFRSLKDNLAALGTWIQTIRQQPLEFDRIYLIPDGQEIPPANDGFFKNMFFQIKAFLLSFTEDYQSMGADIRQEDLDNNNVVTVWMNSGREQNEILQQLSQQYFTRENNTKVNLQLVDPIALLPAVLSGVGPDVALSVPTSDPINFAIRGAVIDLNEFADIKEIKKRFNESALMSYTFDDHLFALPETESFPMFFYRIDIFEQLGLKPPETWDDFYDAVWVLQQQNLTAGYPVNAKPSVISNVNLLGLNIFLYQRNGSLYNEGLTKTNMAEDVNVDAFQEMTELFTLYKFPVDYDFANRFRSGEMPMGIVDYTMYNQLTIFAPEIKGLWAMAPLPGTVQPDGTINNTSPSGGLGAMMLNGVKNKEKTWDFMKWWTSEEIQSKYAIELESVLGPAAKHPTANVEALKNLAWTADEYKSLSSQMGNLTGTPEIPGGYYTARAVDFAFSEVYTQKGKAVTALLDNVKAIDDEITRKRLEFGLD